MHYRIGTLVMMVQIGLDILCLVLIVGLMDGLDIYIAHVIQDSNGGPSGS